MWYVRLRGRIDNADAKPNITLHNPLEAGQGLPDVPTFDLIITMDAGAAFRCHELTLITTYVQRQCSWEHTTLALAALEA